MSMPGFQGGSGYDSSEYGSSAGGAPERGSRRKKIAGYLRAANELRQNHWGANNSNTEEELPGIPGAFPDVAIASSGDAELVLFPSYCKRHVKEEPKLPERNPGENRDSQQDDSNDAEFWKKEWDRWESDKAVVDVDVRGWIYSPHRGPMTRKNRLLVGIARQLSGVPAPKNGKLTSRDASPDMLSRHEEHQAERDQEKIAKEAEKILKQGEGEGEIAAAGGYSEQPMTDTDDEESIYSARRRDNGSSPKEPPGPGHLSSRASWNQPSDMSQAELGAANKNLMARLMPFLSNPVISTPITVFFYDSERSQSKVVMTNEAGHFNIRAALDFVPSHVRVLASESLSAVVEVKITEPKGVSLISDVDDTIKHSSIGSGAREIFRNAFIRDLSDLTIDGVREWYNTMYDMGVGIHYVSNSPWQLFPVLVSYFQTAGLPPGSYHLKQYSGMLQGIFEPVAERKKGTLERIMRDFPARKFILIGDSGEADLEVYTDVVLANPGRILGVFIRDVTTPSDQGFFDSSFNNDKRSKPSNPPLRGWSEGSSNAPDARPPLPARGKTEAIPSGPIMGNLIDFDDEPEQISIHESKSVSDLDQLTGFGDRPKKAPPVRPNKPLALRSVSSESRSNTPAQAPVPGTLENRNVPTPASATATISSRGPPPPPPPRTRQRSAPEEDTGSAMKHTPTSISTSSQYSSSSHHPLSQTQNTSELSSLQKQGQEQQGQQGYISSARSKVASAYNAIPPASSYIPGMNPTATTTHYLSGASTTRRLPRTGIAASARNRLSWTSRNSSAEVSEDEDFSPNAHPSSSASRFSAYPASSTNPAEPVNKKLDLWRRRWKRAKEILGAQGVELRSWRKGDDVAVEAVKLVEKNMREMGVEGYGDGGNGKGKTGEGGGETKVKDLKK